MWRTLGAAGLVFALSACAANEPGPFHEMNTRIEADAAKVRALMDEQLVEIRQAKVNLDEFAVQDAVAAGQLAAQAPVDAAGAMCWPAVAVKLQERQRVQAPMARAGLAVFTEQMTKIIHPQGAPDERLQIACAAFAQRLAKDVLRLIKDGVALYSSAGASGLATLPKTIDVVKKSLALLHQLGVPLSIAP